MARGREVILLCVLYGFTVFSRIYSQQVQAQAPRTKRVCSGTSTGLSTSGSKEERYRSYAYMYENCSYIDGNLEINELAAHHDLSFLSTIEEVSGYVLIATNYVRQVPLTNLRIIRGKTFFKKKFSLSVIMNFDPGNPSVGLEELGFIHLQEISRGQVLFQDNPMLCFHNTINWEDISPDTDDPVTFIEDTPRQRQCEQCHSACYNSKTKERNCWGKGSDMCQNLNHRAVCAKACDARCYGADDPTKCCHKECAAGCNGPTSKDCFVCKNFENEGSCVESCPQVYKYNTFEFEFKLNPDGKYAYGSYCVPKCPDHLLRDDQMSACVKNCRNKYRPLNGSCQHCEGACPKVCQGHTEQTFLSSNDIKTFDNCTVIDGSLKILKNTFDGDPYHNATGITKFEEFMVFKNVKEITGHLTVQFSLQHPWFQNLSFLSNLEFIRGRELFVNYAFSVSHTRMQSLELTSLKEISNGAVMVMNNFDLCFVNHINFTRLFTISKQSDLKMLNKNDSICQQEGHVCDPECSTDGCWGKGPDKCLRCRNKQLTNGTCLASCKVIPKIYDKSDKECAFCHKECANSCTGPNATNCDSCLNVFVTVNLTNNNRAHKCLDACPQLTYADQNKECFPCHQLCDEGCTGPSGLLELGGCNLCKMGKLTYDLNGKEVIECIQEEDDCDAGYYLQSIPVKANSSMAGRQMCTPCDPLCSQCYGSGPAQCTRCVHYREGDYCVKKCRDFNFVNLSTLTCDPCNSECIEGCIGPSSFDCFACKKYKVYLDGTDKFNCTQECPAHLQHLVQDKTVQKDSMTLCADDDHPEVQARMKIADEEDRKKMAIILGCSLGGLVFLGIVVTIVGYHCKQRAKSKEKVTRLTAKMTGYEEEPLTPTDAKPDMALLRLIKESELRRGGIIGSGAFGTVYKGFWMPELDVKIPVAIKVLQEGTSPNQNKELLEEARVMASVDHPCCIRILAVCMTAQMMLITQLMPLGCLLDYVKKQKDNIGSKVLLNWCTQIARGMVYLEERAIVHRDLAARNVLVYSPHQIKITDFGLAKLLDYNEDTFQAKGGLMPIKWLALECIQHHIFTHKSDVWSFGVTVWELFSYGGHPYESVRARDVAVLLEKGERLPQPHICTIDVYMIMIKCWMLDAESRPSFKELEEEFAKMARDPGRYLVIAEDVHRKLPEEARPASGEVTLADNPSPNESQQHDSLMRLPSTSFDPNELARSLSVAGDCPQQTIEAHEYDPRLKRQAAAAAAANFDMSPTSPQEPLLQPYNQSPHRLPSEHRKSPSSSAPNKQGKRHNHLEAAAQARKHGNPTSAKKPTNRRQTSSTNSRYSSDPIKSKQDKTNSVNNDSTVSTMTTYSDVENNRGTNQMKKIGEMDMALLMQGHFNNKPSQDLRQPIVDEDDYLQPKSSKPRAYADIIGNPNNYVNENEDDQSVFLEEAEGKSVYLPPSNPQRLNFQNPEYFDEEPSSAQRQSHSTFKPQMGPGKGYYNDTAANGDGAERTPLVLDNSVTSTTSV